MTKLVGKTGKLSDFLAAHPDYFSEPKKEEPKQSKKEDVKPLTPTINFDMELNSLEELYKNLKINLSSKNPFFIFSKHYQQHRIEVDTDKQRVLIQQIDALRITTKEFLQLKADVLFNEKYLAFTINGRLQEAQIELDGRIAFAKAKISESKLIEANNLAKAQQVINEADTVKVNNKILESHANYINSVVDINAAKAILIKKLAQNIDVSNLDPKTATEFMKIIMTGNIPDNFDELIKEVELQSAKAMADIKTSQAVEADYQAQEVKAKYERNQVIRNNL